MDRRRFLNYAGATAAVVGASAFGVYCSTTRQQFAGTSKSTISVSASTLTSAYSGSSMTNESTSEIGFGNVWESDFGNGDFSDFNLGVDASVGCKNVPPQISDIDRRIADDSTDPLIWERC